MSRLTRLGAVLLTVVMVLAVATPTVLASGTVDIAVTQDDTTYTVEVTHNGTAVENASVLVEPTDPANATYTGDSGTTGPNGTVTFDLPENETEVNVTASFENHSATETFVLSAANDSDEPTWDGQGPFGLWVSSVVHDLLSDGDLDRSFGLFVANLVTANNPGADDRADQANPLGNASGPPAHAANASENASNASSNAGNASDNGNGGPDGSNNGNGGNSSNSGNGNQHLARADGL